MKHEIDDAMVERAVATGVRWYDIAIDRYRDMSSNEFRKMLNYILHGSDPRKRRYTDTPQTERRKAAPPKAECEHDWDASADQLSNWRLCKKCGGLGVDVATSTEIPVSEEMAAAGRAAAIQAGGRLMAVLQPDSTCVNHCEVPTNSEAFAAIYRAMRAKELEEAPRTHLGKVTDRKNLTENPLKNFTAEVVKNSSAPRDGSVWVNGMSRDDRRKRSERRFWSVSRTSCFQKGCTTKFEVQNRRKGDPK